MTATLPARQPLIAVLVLGAAFWLVWRIVAIGVADHLTAGGNAERAAAAAAWLDAHPRALAGQAADPALDFQSQRRLLQTALAGDPSDGRALQQLAAALREPAQQQRADAAAILARRLAPSDVPVLLENSAYWLARNRVPEAVDAWGQALTARPRLSAYLFPVLLQVAESPQSAALKPIALANPPWWEAFFAYASSNAASAQPLRQLLAWRRGSEAPPAAQERGHFVARLQRDGRWGEAYIHWLNSLDGSQRGHVGPLYNGDFEVFPTASGFDWRWDEHPGVLVEVAATYGISGQRALHLVFRGQGGPFRHLSQPLVLAPGSYRLSGNVRPDSLGGGDGLRWLLRCADGAHLAASERFVGMDRWRRFEVDFRVPETGCPGQELRLLAVGRQPDQYRLQWEIWFDGLAIQRR